MQGWELASKSGIIRFNLSEPGGILDGVTISESQTPLGVRSLHATCLTGFCFSTAGAGDVPAAVVALTGVVRNVNVLQSAEAGRP